MINKRLVKKYMANKQMEEKNKIIKKNYPKEKLRQKRKKKRL